MIIRNLQRYQGLDQMLTYIVDTDPMSSKYLRIDLLPVQITAGNNAIKLYGNPSIFKINSPLLIEVLDNVGNTVYQYTPDFYDNLKRRTIVIEVDDYVAPGPGLITICGVLDDAFVPQQWWNTFNFKWQTQLNIAPYESNIADITYITPPTVEFNTRVKPFITASRRNNLEMISYEYGDYKYYDYNYADHVGDADQSSDIYQNNKADTLLGSYVDPSITAFDRDNVFYLREENFSARHVVKNYSILHPGDSFYNTLDTNLIRNGVISGSGLTAEYWDLTHMIGGAVTTAASPNQYKILNLFNPIDYISQRISRLDPGEYYLLRFVDPDTNGVSWVAELGYSAARESGSISVDVTKTIIVRPTIYADGGHYECIIRASNGGPFLHLYPLGTASITNVRLYKISGITAKDFTLNSDLVGGRVRIKNPSVNPGIGDGYVIEDGDPEYSSHIDMVFQKRDSGVDDRFYYDIVTQREKDSPWESYHVIKHKVDKFGSATLYDNQIILYDPLYNYFVDANVDIFPYVNNCLNPVLYIDKLYGTFGYGGRFNDGAIFEYDTITKKFKILYPFESFRTGKNPQGELYSLYDNTTGLVSFFGTCAAGGKYNSGSLYVYTPNNNTFVKLYDFGEYQSIFNIVNRNGGVQPGRSLVLYSGSLYGTTAFGGAYDAGVIYKYDLNSSSYTPLASLPNSYGNTGLLQIDGSLYGVSPFGGTYTSGSIYKYSINNNTLSVIHSFNGVDGQQPDGTLMLASDGNIYATTITSSVAGTGSVLYRIEPSNGDIFTDLVHFNATNTGSFGSAKLFETDGKLYGVCKLGGLYSSGSAFVYDSGSNSIQVIHYFSGSNNNDGSQPAGSMIRLGNSIYGTTRYGGSIDAGTVFRLDLIAPAAPFVKVEGGSIFHNNSILPSRIPSYATLVEDYPRWTGPIQTGEGGIGIYALVELKMKNLIPVTGDVSKIRISAKAKGTKTEFIDLGVYSTKPTDVLMDTNYVNHVQYAYSPYRLTGYFKPVITDYNESLTEDPTIKDSLFLSGWTSGSVTNSYFSETNFHNNIQIIGSPAFGKPVGSIARMKITSSLSGNGMAYMIYTASALPPSSSALNTWQQVTYELFSAYPMLRGIMDVTSSNYYTASSTVDNIGLNSLLVYSALFTNTGSITYDDIFAISPAIDFSKFRITGSSISSSVGEHPYVYHNKLGWKTDDYLLPDTLAISASTYMGLIFEYNSGSVHTLNTTINEDNPHLLDVAGVLSREIGDREYMINKYWEWYSRTKEPATFLSCSASVSSDDEVLMDSVHLYAIDSEYHGALQKNKLVFQTKDAYEFIANTPYIISFNATSRIDALDDIGCEAIDSNFSTGIVPSGSTNLSSWQATHWDGQTMFNNGNYFAYNWFGPYFNTSFHPPSGSPAACANTYMNNGVFTYGAGTYTITIETGEFTYSTLDNPTYIAVDWAGTSYTFSDIQPFNTYSIDITVTTPTSTPPNFTLSSTVLDTTFQSIAHILRTSVVPKNPIGSTIMTGGTEYITNTGYTFNPVLWTSGGFWFGTASIQPTGLYTTEQNFGGYNDIYWWASAPQPQTAPNPGLLTTPIYYYIETGEIPAGNTGTLIIGFSNGGHCPSNCRVVITNPQANTVYQGTATFTLPAAPAQAMIEYRDDGPLIDGRQFRVVKYARLTTDPTYTTVPGVGRLLPEQTTLTVYGVNGSYGVPFLDRIATNDIGEFIGELVHKREYAPGEVKNFGRVEMDFMAEVDGVGKIAFETDAGSHWYLSEISVRPKDRVGLTPGYSRTFIRIPAALVNKPLTVKIEYLNDFNTKSPYVTLLNDIIFTNYDETQATANATIPLQSIGTTTIPPAGGGGSTGPVTNRYNVTGGSAFANAVDPGDLTDVVTDVASLTSVVVNTPDVSLVAGNKVQFNSTDTYSLTYSFTATSTQTLAGGSATSSGLIRFRHYNSSNVLQTTIGTTAFTPPPDTTETLSGTTTINATAGDYVILEIYTTASVTGGTGDDASIDITMDSGYIEVTV